MSTAKSLLVQGYEVVIGFETHTQLTTLSKLFSRASTSFGAEPNTNASAVDFALPGALPVMNKAAVQRAIEFGLAVNAHIAESSVFARKNYFYPDLPKGYQISQFEIPLVLGGAVEFFLEGEKKTVRLVRAHLEEDAGKSLHEDFVGMSGIDLNRAGTPLLEIVTEPDMRSSAEAVAYAKELHKIVTWIGICDGNMQEGSFRCDANVSVRRAGEMKLGTRAEIKNVNSFRFLEKAIQYEVRRQIELIEDGGRVVQETRLYDSDRDETRSMRSKEDAMDYRYFPDPDLLPLEILQDWIDQIRSTMPELPAQMRERLVADLSLSPYDAAQLTANSNLAKFFEDVLAIVGVTHAKLVANWVLGDLSALMNELGSATAPIRPAQLAVLLSRVTDQTISGNAAKEVFRAIASGDDVSNSDSAADVIIEMRGLKQVSDVGSIEKMVDDVIKANQKSVEEYKAGKEKALNALFGQVMKASNKTANPAQVTEILKRKLSS